MSFIKRILKYIKNIFKKQNDIKKINAPQQSISYNKISFQESLKTQKKEIEVPICYGDGLGIHNSIKY